MKIDLTQAGPPARPIPLALELAGQIADANARRHLFRDYQGRRAPETLRQQQRNLALLRDWLSQNAADPGDLYTDPAAWTGLTWGLVADFIRWQLQTGYAISTTNYRLATIKRYAGLALQAGTLDPAQYAMIRAIRSYTTREAQNLDRQRTAAGLPTRRGAKAAAPLLLDPGQVATLKAQPQDTPQGCRDALLMCLLLDHGLRCAEVAGLRRADLRLAEGELHFNRPKVSRRQTHRLSADTLAAARAYLAVTTPAGDDPLLRRSRKDGSLQAAGLTPRAITQRVHHLGQQLGLAGLSAHDCRHTWATQAARAGTDLLALQEAGGWTSLAMPRRYVEAAKIANEGVRLE